VTLRWLITRDGHTKDVVITEDTLGNPAASQCIAKEIRHIRFPPGEDEIEIDGYPFIFSSR
jgi:hypothetical protein